MTGGGPGIMSGLSSGYHAHDEVEKGKSGQASEPR